MEFSDPGCQQAALPFFRLPRAEDLDPLLVLFEDGPIAAIEVRMAGLNRFKKFGTIAEKLLDRKSVV